MAAHGCQSSDGHGLQQNPCPGDLGATAHGESVAEKTEYIEEASFSTLKSSSLFTHSCRSGDPSSTVSAEMQGETAGEKRVDSTNHGDVGVAHFDDSVRQSGQLGKDGMCADDQQECAHSATTVDGCDNCSEVTPSPSVAAESTSSSSVAVCSSSGSCVDVCSSGSSVAVCSSSGSCVDVCSSGSSVAVCSSGSSVSVSTSSGSLITQRSSSETDEVIHSGSSSQSQPGNYGHRLKQNGTSLNSDKRGEIVHIADGSTGIVTHSATGGISKPDAEGSSPTAERCDKRHLDETDQSDSDIISLSEEDISNEDTTGFIITNVCSLSDKYSVEKHGQSVNEPDTERGQGEAGDATASEEECAILGVSDCQGQRSSAGVSQTSEDRKGSVESCSVCSGSAVGSSGSHSQFLSQQSGEHVTILTKPQKRNEVVVLDFKDFKNKNATEFLLTGKKINDKLSTLTSSAKLLQAVSGLVAAEDSGSPSQPYSTCTVGVALNQREMGTSASRSAIDGNSSRSVVESECVASNKCVPCTSQGSAVPHTLASPGDPVVSGDREHPAVSGDREHPAGSGDREHPAETHFSPPAQSEHQMSPSVAPVNVVEKMTTANNNLPVSSSDLSATSELDKEIKTEPVDSGYGIGTMKYSATSREAAPVADRLNCASSETGPTEEGSEMSDALSREKKKGQLDAALKLLNIGTCTARSDSSTQASLDLGSTTTISRDTAGALGLLNQRNSDTPSSVKHPPSSRRKSAAPRSTKVSISTAASQSPQYVTAASSAASSIVLTIPTLVSKGIVCTKAASTPLSLSSVSTPSISSAGSVSKTGADSKELNDKMLTHLHGIQGKPGSQQVLKIPMADGSTHTVKVIFAPQAQLPPPVISSTIVSSSLSSVSSGSALSVSVAGVLSSSAPQALLVTSTKHDDVANVSKCVSNRKQTTAVRPKPNTSKPAAGERRRPIVPASASSVSAPPSSGKKLDVIEGKLSVGDMASLIQGQNQLPRYKPPSECPGFSAPPVFRCAECADSFSTVSGYSAHVKRMSMVIRYACMTCSTPLVFFNKCTFLAHLRLHASMEQLSGTVFNLKSYTMSVSSLPDALLPLTGEHHMDPIVANHRVPLDCTECSTTLPSTLELAKHFGCEVTNCQYEHSCPHCMMELPTDCSLKAHLRLHLDDHMISAQPPYVCPECGLCFPNQSSLYQHIFATCLHFNRFVPLHCKVCSYIALSRHVLQIHLQQRHNLQHVMCCLICQKRVFKTPALFTAHLVSVHNRPQPSDSELPELYRMVYYCPVCQGKFEDYSTTHTSTHLAEMSASPVFAFACTLCKQPFVAASRKDLISHLTSDHEAYRFKCAMCCLGFVSMSVLRVHVLSEHTLPNEQCQTCNFFIAWPEAVLPHVLWHIVKNVQENNTTGCSTDTVNVMDIQTLQLVKSKVREKLFCRLCGQMFVTAAFLQHHLKGHKFWNKTICCVCQRVDFHGRPQTESHQATCLMQWRVKHAVALKATGLLQLKAGRGGDGSTEEDEGPNTSCSTQEKSIKLGGSHQAGIPGNAVGTKRSLSSVLRLKGPPAKKAATSLLSNPSSSATPNANMRKTPPSRQSPPAANNHQSSLVLGHKKLCTRTAKSCDSAHASPSDDGSSDNETESEDNKFRKSHFPPFLQDHEAAEESVRLLYHPCHLCGLTYESKDTLMGHYASVHSGKKNVYFCMVCRKRGKEQSFSKMQLLVSHCVRKHRLSAQEAEGMAKNEAVQPKVQKTGEVYPMPVTTQPTGSPKPATPDTSPVKRLRVAGDVEQEFVCAKCIFSASNQEEFRSHITQHKVDNSVQCLECGLCFSVIPSLKKHLFMVHRIRQPQAYIKEHNITLQDLPNELVSHMNQFPPLGEQEFVININRAPVVNKEVPKSSKKELKVLIEETKRNASLLECTVCYREFEDEAQLKSHMRTHGMAFIRSRRTNARDSTGQREQPTEKEKNDPETICQT